MLWRSPSLLCIASAQKAADREKVADDTVSHPLSRDATDTADRDHAARTTRAKLRWVKITHLQM